MSNLNLKSKCCGCYAPVKLFCPNPPPGQPRGKRKYACDKKGRGTRKKRDYSVYIGQGKVKKKREGDLGNPPKNEVPGDAWGGGDQNNLTDALHIERFLL